MADTYWALRDERAPVTFEVRDTFCESHMPKFIVIAVNKDHGWPVAPKLERRGP